MEASSGSGGNPRREWEDHAMCASCPEPCRERGNGAVNLCEDCAHRALLDGEKLRELGERVLEILALETLPAGFNALDKIGAVRNAARDLGLLGGEVQP